MKSIGGRFKAQLRELVRSERGIALPMALMITVIAMGFAAVPIVASVNSQSGDTRNQGGNEALAAAEAGAELGVLRQSALLTENEKTTVPSCVPATKLASTGWCTPYPAKRGTAAGKIGNAEYQYQVRPCYSASGGECAGVPVSEPCALSENKLLVQVVSTGFATVGGREVTQRVELTGCAQGTNPAIETLEEDVKTRESELIAWERELNTREETQHTHEVEKTAYENEVRELTEEIERVKNEPAGYEEGPGPNEKYFETVKTPPPNVWAGGQIVGVEWLNLNNNAQIYNGGAGSNGSVTLTGSANVCGSITYGTKVSTDNSSSNTAPSGCAAGRKLTHATTSYPAVTLPADIALNNSDNRLCAEAACHAGLDPVGSNVYQRGNLSWNGSNKQLTLKYDQLTLEGTAPYYLCQLILEGGGKLYSGSGKTIKIYFAPPSSCPGLNGAPQLVIANGTFVGADANHGPGFYFVGTAGTVSSSNPESRIELAGGASDEQIVIYAPQSKIVANNGVNISGALVGKTLELGGGASINRNGTFTPPTPETFLPSSETTVEKEREGPKIKTPSKYIRELEERRSVTEGKITTKSTEIVNDGTTISEIQERIVEARERVTEAQKHLEDERNAGGTAAEPIERQAFVQCTAAPPAVGSPADTGC